MDLLQVRPQELCNFISLFSAQLYDELTANHFEEELQKAVRFLLLPITESPFNRPVEFRQ
jgi:hypothetical protein